MTNSLAKRVIALEQEIRNLKTSHYKTMSAVRASYANFNITLDMTLYQGVIPMSDFAFITLESEEPNQLMSCTLDGVSTLEDRAVLIRRLFRNESTTVFVVNIAQGNQSDQQTLLNGGEVSITYGIEVSCTARASVYLQYASGV